MDIKELLDDDAFSQDKLFNNEEYNTLIIGREGLSAKENKAADLIESLLEEKSREELEQIFQKLKELNAQALLVEGIKKASRPADKASLAAACWESGLDFSDYFSFFTSLAVSDDFRLAMEAVTVIENCEGPIAVDTLRSALQTAQTSSSKHTALTGDLVTFIKKNIQQYE